MLLYELWKVLSWICKYQKPYLNSADLTFRSPSRAWLSLDFPSCPLKFVPLHKLQGWCFHWLSFSGVHSNINLVNRMDFNSEDFLTQSESVGAFSPWQFGSFPVLMPQDRTLSPDRRPRLLCCLQALKLIRKLLSREVQVSFKYNLFAVWGLWWGCRGQRGTSSEI